MSAPATGDIPLEVIGHERTADDVVVLTLAHRDRAPLPLWQPGAHIDLFLPGGDIRQYSLCSDPADRAVWRLGVLREEEGRGGSRWIADDLRVGDAITAAGPRSHFPFDPSSPRPAVLVAGGIGITPILAMASAAQQAGRDYELHYAGHRGRMGFLDELRDRHGDRLVAHVTEEGTRLDLTALADGAATAGAELVCCGPTRLIDALTAEAERTGIPLTVEHFEPAELTVPVWHETFEVELALSGLTIEVGPDQSVLSAIEDAGVLVLSSCTEGTCGTCETPVLSGEVDHRDSILSPAQRARNDLMFVCVSRAACPRLVLDL
ncbi:PDR/VanB family oxidoreductase [Microbacterium sp.]|uniref:PDR/VanB family oxidoreductase n=1 Tax=Microbacterium sp. TaxID=51671 RepID=UPI0039E568B4